MTTASQPVIDPGRPGGRSSVGRILLLAAAATGIALSPATAQEPAAPQAPPASASASASADGADGAAGAAGADRDRADAAEAAYHFARAKLLADSGAFDQALAAFRRALELDRSDPYSLIEVSKFHAYLAQISQGERKQLANLQAAAEYAAQARELAPENLDVLRSYGRLHMRLVELRQLESLELARGAFEDLRAQTEGDLQVLMSLGQLYLWLRDHAAAVEVLREAASFRPNHPTIEGMLVDTLVAAGEEREAEEVLERIVGRDPASLEDRLRWAELVSSRGDHRRAVEILRSGPQHPPSVRRRQLLARELHLAGANAEALALTETLRREVPGGHGIERLRVAILSGLTRYEEAIAELEPLLAAAGDDAPLQDELLLSRLLERVGRPDAAADRLRALAAKAPEPHALQVKMALLTLLERQGLGEEAVDLVRREVLAASAEEAGRWGRMQAQLLVRLDRIDEALETVDRTIERTAADGGEVARSRLQKLTIQALVEDWQGVAELSSTLLDAEMPEVRAAAYLFHGEALAELGRLDEALARLAEGEEKLGASGLLAKRIEILFAHDRGDEARRLLAERTASGEAGDLLFAAQVHQRGERYGEAIPLLDRLLAEDPSSLQTQFFLGSAYERAGQPERAVDTFQRLLERAPDHGPTLNYLGYMWAERGTNLDQALALLLRAVALEPDNGAYVDSLGWAYFQLGRYQGARRHLEWAARLIPDDPTILEHLGDLYVVLKDLERARDSYQQALDLGGDGADEVRRKLRDLEGKGL